jgi:hypothetical protein
MDRFLGWNIVSIYGFLTFQGVNVGSKGYPRKCETAVSLYSQKLLAQLTHEKHFQTQK